MNTGFLLVFFFHRGLFFALRHNHTRRDYKKQPHQKRLVKNVPGKTALGACGADLRAQPTIDLGFNIFKKKKGKSRPTANTTIYSMSCISMARLSVALPSDRAGVSVSRV